MSTILLAENEKTSSSKRTCHLNIKYYFIMDQIKNGHMKVAFCPKQEMIADFYMKPQQGALFMRMCEMILNLPAVLTFTGVCWNYAETHMRKEIGKVKIQNIQKVMIQKKLWTRWQETPRRNTTRLETRPKK